GAELTIINAHVYPGPGEPPIEGANISISDGRISAIYSGTPINSTKTIDAGGRTVTAGLWNSHVHFTDPRIRHSAEQMVRDMFLRYGFTTVIDAGSELEDTLTLKKRIDEGELAGPRILTANGSFVFTDGTPSYLPDVRLPEVNHPLQAEPMVAEVLESGANGIKIFSGSFQGPRDPIYLPPKIIRAIADAAHARKSFVMSHPTDRTGLINAVENGVDVLAHTAPQAGLFGRDLVATMKRNNVAVVPTLTLWRIELERAGVKREDALAFQSMGVRQLSEYVGAGGEILFGTDVGYIDVFDTAEELQLMHAAGMTFDAILAAMTTVPANRFLRENARLAEGEPADIVIFASSPAQDVTAFSEVAYTIKAGRVVYQNQLLEDAFEY
ncbi:MAG: amidohydrolase family protein, partial [Pseudomonadota bacterium]